MKAIVQDRYGGPDVLRLLEIEDPVPRADEVVIAVDAVSLNLSDWEMLTGRPLYARVFGLFSPGRRVIGSDLTGRVVQVGSRVTTWKPGDEVYADTMGSFGGFAELARAKASVLHRKPKGLSFEDASTLPQAAPIAIQGLRFGGGVQPGDHVLINGAGGGSGMFAIQLAKLWGARVTGVDNAEKLDHMRSLGADHVLDYRVTDFTQAGQKFDHVLDLVGTRSLAAHRRALADGGRYTVVGGTMASILQTALWGPIWGKLSGVKMGMLAVEANRADDLNLVSEHLQSGAMKVFIDRCHSLEEVPEALRYLGEGHARGKLVIRVGSRRS